MAVTATPVFTQTPSLSLAQILPADTTAAKTVVTAGANGTKVTGLSASSNDAARIVVISLVRSAVVYILTTVTVAANAGTDGTVAATNLINTTILPSLPIDNDGQPYLLLKSGDTLTAAVTVAVTAAKTISIAAIGADF